MASTSYTERSRESRARLPLRLTLIALALCAAVAYPTTRFGGREGLRSMLLGAGLSWMTVIASYAAIVVAFRNVKQLQMVIVLGGFLVRMLMLFGLLTLIAKTMTVNLSQLVLWLVGFYLVLVVAEAWTLSNQTRARRIPEA